MAMSFNRERLTGMSSLSHAAFRRTPDNSSPLARCEEHPETLGLTVRPSVPAIGDGESGALEVRDQHVDREFGEAWQRENRRVCGAVLADPGKVSADLVKLAADFANEAEPLRGQQDRPLRA